MSKHQYASVFSKRNNCKANQDMIDNLSSHIRYEIDKKGITLQEAAKRSAVTLTTLCHYAKAQSFPKEQNFRLIEKWLKKTEQELIFSKCEKYQEAKEEKTKEKDIIRRSSCTVKKTINGKEKTFTYIYPNEIERGFWTDKPEKYK